MAGGVEDGDHAHAAGGLGPGDHFPNLGEGEDPALDQLGPVGRALGLGVSREGAGGCGGHGVTLNIEFTLSAWRRPRWAERRAPTRTLALALLPVNGVSCACIVSCLPDIPGSRVPLPRGGPAADS